MAKSLLLLALAVDSVIALSANAGAQTQPMQAGQTFRDCSDCPEMVVVPPGTFTMGVPPGEEEYEKIPEIYRHLSEPQHLVTILNGFALGKFDVTVDEFAKFVKETGFRVGTSCSSYLPDPVTHQWQQSDQAPGVDWQHPGFPQKDRDPVVCVNWQEAKAYLAWLNQKTGKLYRLPSESEWEYAARAGTKTARFWGDGLDKACRFANVRDLTKANALHFLPAVAAPCSTGFTYVAPVGSFAPNGFGLYDMLGNVWQLTEDCWNPNYVGAPDGGAPATTGDCAYRITRGGSWNYLPSVVRNGFRYKQKSVDSAINIGFRLARAL